MRKHPLFCHIENCVVRRMNRECEAFFLTRFMRQPCAEETSRYAVHGAQRVGEHVCINKFYHAQKAVQKWSEI